MVKLFLGKQNLKKVKPMTCQTNDTATSKIIETILAEGFGGVGKTVEILLNEAMRIERTRHLQAEPYERTEQRQGYANGFKSRDFHTRLGSIELQVPQVRDGNFYPSIIEKGQRSERALCLAAAEMYVTGVSTRKVEKVMEKLCGFNISSTEVSNASKLLDEELAKWRTRSLGKYKYIFLDAEYEKVRQGGHVLSCAILIAVGIDEFGKRDVLGVSVKLSEAEVHWREFLQSLQARGLHGIELITSDAHVGLKAALRAVFPSVPWQRCQFHLQQNAQSYVTKMSQRESVGSSIRAIFNAPNKADAERLLQITSKKYESEMPRLADWMITNLPEGFAIYAFPEKHWRRLRTSNVLERLNREIRRRTKAVGVFPNEASCERLISAVLLEISDEWQTDKVYLDVG
jgi:putative transposase